MYLLINLNGFLHLCGNKTKTTLQKKPHCHPTTTKQNQKQSMQTKVLCKQCLSKKITIYYEMQKVYPNYEFIEEQHLKSALQNWNHKPKEHEATFHTVSL